MPETAFAILIPTRTKYVFLASQSKTQNVNTCSAQQSKLLRHAYSIMADGARLQARPKLHRIIRRPVAVGARRRRPERDNTHRLTTQYIERQRRRRATHLSHCARVVAPGRSALHRQPAAGRRELGHRLAGKE